MKKTPKQIKKITVCVVFNLIICLISLYSPLMFHKNPMFTFTMRVEVCFQCETGCLTYPKLAKMVLANVEIMMDAAGQRLHSANTANAPVVSISFFFLFLFYCD